MVLWGTSIFYESGPFCFILSKKVFKSFGNGEENSTLSFDSGWIKEREEA
jgi:hypothetical protein